MPAGYAGYLKKWFADKGFGFIQPDDMATDIFTHIRQKTGDSQEIVTEGRRVFVEFEVDPTKAKPKATKWYFTDSGAQQVQQPVMGMGGVQAQAQAGGNYQSLIQQAQQAAAAMGQPGGCQGNMMGGAVAGAVGGAVGGCGQQVATGLPTPPPAPVAQVYAVQEVQVPAALMNEVVGAGGSHLEAIKKKAGGDVQIELGGGGVMDPNGVRTLKVRGPAVSAGLGACLLLQRLAEVM